MKMFRFLAVFVVLFPSFTQAQPTNTDNFYLTDMREYLSSPAQWEGRDWLKLGAIVTGVAIITERVDDRWKDEMTTENHPIHNARIANIGNAWGDLSLSGPFMLGVYGYGRWNHDSQYLEASRNMLQSAVYAGLVTTGLKMTIQRNRPCDSKDESGWFKSGRSFPSGHTNLAFAVSRSYLNSIEQPSLAQKLLFYGLATSTAFARTYDNRHWASDVVAGAVLGIYTADFVTAQREKKHHGNYAVAPFISSDVVGLQVSWN